MVHHTVSLASRLAMLITGDRHAAVNLANRLAPLVGSLVAACSNELASQPNPLDAATTTTVVAESGATAGSDTGFADAANSESTKQPVTQPDSQTDSQPDAQTLAPADAAVDAAVDASIDSVTSEITALVPDAPTAPVDAPVDSAVAPGADAPGVEADSAKAAEVAVDSAALPLDSADVTSADTAKPAADVEGNSAVWNPKPGPADTKLEFTGATLKSGADMILCWYVPPDGKDHWANAFDATFEESIHHLRVDRILDTVGKKAFGPVDCMDKADSIPNEPGWTTTAELPGSGTKSAKIQFPAGQAFKIGKEHGLHYEVHVSNESSKPKTIKGYYQIHTIPEAEVETSLGLFMHFNPQNKHPPGVSMQTSLCKMPQDVYFLFGTGHMHYFGVNLSYKVDGKLIYQTQQVVDVPFQAWPMPGLLVKAGQTVSLSCTYDNPLKTTLVNGFSNTLNAMCGFVAYFYPTVDSAPILCQ